MQFFLEVQSNKKKLELQQVYKNDLKLKTILQTKPNKTTLHLSRCHQETVYNANQTSLGALGNAKPTLQRAVHLPWPASKGFARRPTTDNCTGNWIGQIGQLVSLHPCSNEKLCSSSSRFLQNIGSPKQQQHDGKQIRCSDSCEKVVVLIRGDMCKSNMLLFTVRKYVSKKN